MKKPLDLNLLFVAESLYRTLNVSKTAKELNVTQSAISHALSKLREHFDDALFVRASKGMTLTDVAKKLRPKIESLVSQATALSDLNQVFNPMTAERRITIAASDYVEVLLMPQILARLKKEAPLLQVSFKSTGGVFPKEELENGTYDFAIAGFYKDIGEGFYTTRVFEDTFSTAYRKNHSVIRGKIKPAQFYELDHALITLQADFKDNYERKLLGKMMKRNIVFGTYSFTSMAWTLSKTDLVLTAPTKLLKKYQEYFPIIVEETPVPSLTVQMRMVWHARNHKDPVSEWFRELLKEEFDKLR